MNESSNIKPVITLDTDWAPDFVIDFVTDLLVESNVKATWFVTHDSPAIQRLSEHPTIFEIGIHPNFLPHSDHGDTTEEVLATAMKLAPNAGCVRTHALVQSTPLLNKIMSNTSIHTDVSLFLPRVIGVEPFPYHCNGRTIMRIPYCWEDDYEMQAPEPTWHLKLMQEPRKGLMVLDFHPIHVYLNSSNMAPYESIKSRFGSLRSATSDTIEPYVASGLGTRTFFEEVIDYLRLEGRSWNISDLSPLR